MSTTTLAGGLVVRTRPLPSILKKASDSDRAAYGIPSFTVGTDRDKTVEGNGAGSPLRRTRVHAAGTVAQASSRPQCGPWPETTDIWSGGIAFPRGGDKIFFVVGNWNIPKAAPPTGPQNGVWYSASSWVGIDGDDGSGDVLQAGCDADVMISGGNAQHQFNPWWEWFPAGSFWITNMPAEAGDKFTCWIQCLSLIAGSPDPNTALIFLANVTQGMGLFFFATAPSNVSLQGNCPEWIVEALEINTDTPELVKYSTVKFTNCRCVTVGDKLIDSGGGNTIDMVNSGGTVIPRGKLVGSTEVEVSYV